MKSAEVVEDIWGSFGRNRPRVHLLPSTFKALTTSDGGVLAPLLRVCCSNQSPCSDFRSSLGTSVFSLSLASSFLSLSRTQLSWGHS